MSNQQLCGEFPEDVLDLGVVSDNSTALAQVAWGTCEDEVVGGRIASLGLWDQVVDVEHATICVEELQDAALGDCGAGRSCAAVATDAAVALGDLVTSGCRYIAGITHATNLATRAAERAVS